MKKLLLRLFNVTFEKRLNSALAVFSKTLVELQNIQEDIQIAMESKKNEIHELNVELKDLDTLSSSNSAQIKKIKQFIS